MKILLVTTGLGLGGAERQVCDLADEFVRKGHIVQIMSLNLRKEVAPNSSQVKIFSLSMDKTLSGLLVALYRARNLLKEFRPDIVHSHMYHANIFSRILRSIARMPRLICTVHSSYEGGKFRVLLYRATDRLASINTVVSEYAQRAFIESGAMTEERLVVVRNGIDTDRFKFRDNARQKFRDELKIASNDIFLLAVGRLEDEKNYPELIRAFELVSQQEEFSRKLKLFIVGQGTMSEGLKNLVDERHLNDKIFFVGAKKDVENWFSASDVFVLPSLYEGFGLVALEALASERMVVTTNNIGVKGDIELFGEVAPSAYALEIADKIRVAIQRLHDFNGAEARRYIIDKYSIQSVSTQWLEIYAGTDEKSCISNHKV
ncbi:glycosyltransferase [Vibrio hepatarius]|uniref:glycosyltransferase n=1 Tax=Vibrio hepatarius TaxID=171383 RepID=UPI003735EDA8